jgi:carbonic anhydrase
VVRVAGNVCNDDEMASIEYGLLHVHTPVMLLLGHTQCGAVTATVQRFEGRLGALERNIPPLLDTITPAVEAAKKKHPGLSGEALTAAAIEENIWRGIEQVLLKSPAIRKLLREEKVKLVGANYDVGTGAIHWLPELKTIEILNKVENDPARAIEPMGD